MKAAPIKAFDRWHRHALELAEGASFREQITVYLRTARQFEAMAADPSNWPKMNLEAE
jgi:hypothetical protein